MLSYGELEVFSILPPTISFCYLLASTGSLGTVFFFGDS